MKFNAGISELNWASYLMNVGWYLVHLLWIVRFALVMVKSLSKCIKEDLSWSSVKGGRIQYMAHSPWL